MVSKFALMVVSPNSKNGEEDHTVNHMGKWADVSGYKSGKWADVSVDINYLDQTTNNMYFNIKFMFG